MDKFDCIIPEAPLFEIGQLVDFNQAQLRDFYPLRARRGVARHPAQPVAQWELDTAQTVVLFAGLGGACQGLEEAGCPVNVANNHDPIALAAHRSLHPHTRHIRGSIWDVDPVLATGGRPVKLLWASPDCTGFSVAAGGAPRSPRVRSLPWQVCRWIAKSHPRIVFIENVSDIRHWTRLVAQRCKQTGRVVRLDGTVAAPGERVPLREQALVPDKKAPGRRFAKFVAHLRALGAIYEDRDLCAADYGVPTSRTRYFAVLRFDGEPICWPERTRAPRAIAHRSGLQDWTSAGSIVDWSRPIPSIFGRKKPLVAATMRRLSLGLKRFVLNCPDPYFIPVPAAWGRIGDCEIHDMLVAAWMVQHNLGMVGRSLRDPLSTLTTSGSQQQIAAVYLVKLRGTSTAQSAHDPVPTLTAGGNHIALAAAFLQQCGASAAGCAGGVPAARINVEGVNYAVVDIGMRMLEPAEAARAHELVLPNLIAANGQNRPLYKAEAMRLIGNSVPKRMARLLAEANKAHTLYLPARNQMAAD